MSQSNLQAPAGKTIDAQQIPGFYVVGLSVVTSNEDGKASDDINTLWQRFFEEDVLHRIEGRADNVLYAVYHDYEGDHTKPYRLTIGCKIDGEGRDLPQGLHKIHVPTADYVLFAARGEQPKALLDTWENVWKSDLKRTYKTDLEIYGPRFFEEGVHEVLVCVGVTL